MGKQLNKDYNKVFYEVIENKINISNFDNQQKLEMEESLEKLKKSGLDSNEKLKCINTIISNLDWEFEITDVAFKYAKNNIEKEELLNYLIDLIQNLESKNNNKYNNILKRLKEYKDELIGKSQDKNQFKDILENALEYINKNKKIVAIAVALIILIFVFIGLSKAMKKDDYLVDGINERYITEQELKEYSKEQLPYIRNEIYARHGFIFHDNIYKPYFEKQSWYKPNPEFKGEWDAFNDYERKNILLIKELEQE